MAARRLQSLNSVYSFHHSISLFSSIEGIFSREIGNGTRTLQDLIQLLQPLKLALYQGSELYDVIGVGQGGSYRVFRCSHLKKRLVAAKTMKLPLELLAKEKENFRRRVFCLIKDLEVMRHPPLAEHENILGLLGYGWNLFEDSALPFLVTEYAEQGTLREFLRNNGSSVVSRLKFCGNIASGLHAMHLCGLSHGDLKLENVLVFRQVDEVGSHREQYTAKLSDFGHSCMNSPEQAYSTAQSYRGTIGYMAPELYQANSAAINFPKCDIWTLALLVWEVLAGGSRYTENYKVKSLLDQQTSKLPKTNEVWSNDDTGRDPASRPGHGFFSISEHLCQMAVDFADVEVNGSISPESQALVKQIFRMSLQKDPIKRCADVSKLPFTYSKHRSTKLSYADGPFVEPAAVQVDWSFEGFTPQELRASKVPHTTKAEMVADAKSAAMAASGAQENIASLTLYVGLAYGVGFGVEQNAEESLVWISRSATQGSSAASLILEILENPELQQEKILRAFKNSVEGPSNSSGQGTCRFAHHNSIALNLSSFSSVDGCNPLHYLSLFEGFTDPLSHLKSARCDILKRMNIQDNHPSIAERGSWGGNSFFPRISFREQRLAKIAMHLGPKFIHTTTTRVHFLDAHFPMTLSGTPLSFAILLNCREAIGALVNQVPFSLELAPSELETAVSCHRLGTFNLLWSEYLNRSHDKTFDLFIQHRKGSSLISALAKRSSLERTMLHGPNCSSARKEITTAVILSLYDLVTQEYSDDEALRLTSSRTFGEIVGEGLEQIIEYGDLDVAIEVRQTIASRNFAPSPNEPYGQGVFKTALNMACSGIFDLGRSKRFLDFARDCRKDLNPDFQALKTMIEHRSQALFLRCMEYEISFNGFDEEGQSLLHYIIKTGFYELVPISLVISRGADPNHASKEGQTPLHLAARRGLPLIVKELLADGADPSAADKTGTSVLLQAVISRNTSTVTEILEALKAKVETSQSMVPLLNTSQTGFHFLSNPSYRPNFEYRRIDQDNMIDRYDIRDSPTALHMAAKNHDLEIVRLLLHHGAGPEVRDLDGNLALHCAAQGTTNGVNGATSCCHLLLEAQKRNLPRNKKGDTPLHLAAQCYPGHALIKVLNCFVKEHRCNINIQNALGRTILHEAASQHTSHRFVESFATILEFGATPNQRDAEGRTAMHLLVQAVHSSSRRPWKRDRLTGRVLETLADAGADPLIRDNSRDPGGYTAMDYAAINGVDALFFQLYEIACQNLHKSGELQISHDFAAKKQWLSSAWSLSVAEEQWHMVKQVMTYRSDFDADLSLLMWPAGAHLLKYAIAVNDTPLLRRFSQRPLGGSHERRISSVPVGEQSDHLRGSDENLDSKAHRTLTCWTELPSYLRSNPSRSNLSGSAGRRSPDWHGSWSLDQLKFWETLVERHNIHRGGDPLNEIFDFIFTLDRQTICAYYGNANQQRALASVKAFKWKDHITSKTPYRAIDFLQVIKPQDRPRGIIAV